MNDFSHATADLSDVQVERMKVLLATAAGPDPTDLLSACFHSLAAGMAQELDTRRAMVRELHERLALPAFQDGLDDAS